MARPKGSKSKPNPQLRMRKFLEQKGPDGKTGWEHWERVLRGESVPPSQVKALEKAIEIAHPSSAKGSNGGDGGLRKVYFSGRVDRPEEAKTEGG